MFSKMLNREFGVLFLNKEYNETSLYLHHETQRSVSVAMPCNFQICFQFLSIYYHRVYGSLNLCSYQAVEWKTAGDSRVVLGCHTWIVLSPINQCYLFQEASL